MRRAGDHEQACCRVAGLFPERWLRLYAAAKLRKDPVFPAAFEVFRDTNEPVLDLGCGVGLLGAYLRERGFTQPVIGIDCDQRKIRRARQIARRGDYPGLEFACADARKLPPDFRGNVAVFDLLHYLSAGYQAELLANAAERLTSSAIVAIRDAPQDRTARFWFTYAGELFAQALSWNRATRLHFPSQASIDAAFEQHEFQSEIRPLWGRTPFNNHLFLFRRRASAAVPEPV